MLPPRLRNYRGVSVGCETLRNTVAKLSFSYCDNDLEFVRFPIMTNVCSLICHTV